MTVVILKFMFCVLLLPVPEAPPRHAHGRTGARAARAHPSPPPIHYLPSNLTYHTLTPYLEILHCPYSWNP